MNREQLFIAIGDLPDSCLPEWGAPAPNKTRPAVWRRWGLAAACLAVAFAALLSAVPRTGGGTGAPASPPPTADRPPTGISSPSSRPEPDLPVLRYGRVSAVADLSLAPPEGGTSRAVTREDIAALLGGEEALSGALGWADYELSGTVFFQPDGSIWILDLYGYRGPLDHFSLTLSPGRLPPTCELYGESLPNQILGTEVMADRYDSDYGLSRRVSFLHGDVGYRFTVSGESGTGEAVEELVSRFVLHALLQGADLSAVSSEGALPIETGEPTFSVGEPNWED